MVEVGMMIKVVLILIVEIGDLPVHKDQVDGMMAREIMDLPTVADHQEIVTPVHQAVVDLHQVQEAVAMEVLQTVPAAHAQPVQAEVDLHPNAQALQAVMAEATVRAALQVLPHAAVKAVVLQAEENKLTK
jgi:hypothetical protein